MGPLFPADCLPTPRHIHCHSKHDPGSKPWLLLQGIEEAGTRLAQVLTKKESIAKMKSAMPADVAKSLARVSGGLYVVAAVNKTARGAMLASWVAQASFEPLGLTVAVAKDRAIESLMQVRASSSSSPLLCGVLVLLLPNLQLPA